MKIKGFLAGLVAAAMVVPMAACGSQGGEVSASGSGASSSISSDASVTSSSTDEATSIVVTDMVGREVEIIPGSYENVVCIGAGALRIYSYVGDVELLSGVEDIDNTSLTDRPQMFDGVARPYLMVNEEVFASLPSCGVGGPNAQEAEAEKILSCNPDIVISEYEDVDKANALEEQLGIPVVTLKGTMNVFSDDFKSSLSLLGTVFDKDERAEEIVGFIENEQADIAQRTADIAEEDKPSVYICGLGNWGTTNHLFTSQTYASFMAANIKNVVTDLGMDGVGQIEAEKFVSLGDDMDIMFIDAAAVKNIKPLYAEDNTLLDSAKAWRDGEVYLEMAYNAYYTNYEIMLANTWYIAKTVYPEQFEDIDITEKLNEITEMFCGEELADEIYEYPASFGGYQEIDTETFFAS